MDILDWTFNNYFFDGTCIHIFCIKNCTKIWRMRNYDPKRVGGWFRITQAVYLP